MTEWYSRIRVVREVKLYYGDKLVLDELGARLLEGIERYGSILMAARVVGLPYSRAWGRIAKAESILGVEIVSRRRGGRRGGGTTLTEAGRRLLERYRRASSRRGLLHVPVKPLGTGLLVAGSHDIMLELVAGTLRRKGVDVETAWIGSGGGLAALMLGEADAAPMHLYDEASGKYNIPFLRKYWLSGRVSLIVGYERELVVAYRGEINAGSPEEVFRLLGRGYRLVNRNPGSGTRQVIDSLLRRVLGERYQGVPGYGFEVSTHLNAARAVASGEADIGVMLRQAAEFYRLRWLHLKWEEYDVAVLNSSLAEGRLRPLVDALQPDRLRGLVSGLPGYRLREDTGKIVKV